MDRSAAVQALAESEGRFRALFEKSPIGTALVDPESTIILDCNDVAAAIVGCSVEEFRGRPIMDFALDTAEHWAREMLISVAAGASTKYETRVKGRDGPRHVIIAAAPVQMAGRTLVLLQQVDITERRVAEAELRDNAERLQLAREGANLGIWDWDVAAGILTWSDQNWALHGLEPRPGGPTPELWASVIDPADVGRVRAELGKALNAPNRYYACEYDVLLPGGARRRLLGRGQAIHGAAGNAVRMVGINMDVTARYEAEKARDQLIAMLENERARLAEVVESLPIGAGIVDANGRVVLGNAMLRRLNGPFIYSFNKQPIGDWMAFDADGGRLAVENYPIRRALEKGETVLPGVEFLYRDPSGRETWIRVGSLPLRRENGRVTEALAIMQDIEAEKRLLDIQQQINARLEMRVREEMAAREAAQERAAHAERMQALGQLAGGIAHDFNNVLQAVSGGAALIERRPEETERVVRNARMILDATRRGAAITSRLLAFSRRGDLRAEQVDAAALLRDMADVLTHTLGGGVVCEVDAAPRLPPLFADRGQLETVLVNLATNARDAMPNGGTLTLSADLEVVSPALPHTGGLAAGRYIRIAVRDTGSGMDPSVLARVTEPFFTTKEPGKGTGLGLAMAKGFVEQSGGDLSIDSEVGKGTRIILWLPVVETSNASAEPARFASGERPRVMLVDDDPIVRSVLSRSLEDAGCVVWAEENAEQALARLAGGEAVDIVVTDLTMPGMDGLTLIRSVRQQRPAMPAILLTGYVGDSARVAETDSFLLLRKPVTGAQLMERIDTLLATPKQMV